MIDGGDGEGLFSLLHLDTLAYRASRQLSARRGGVGAAAGLYGRRGGGALVCRFGSVALCIAHMRWLVARLGGLRLSVPLGDIADMPTSGKGAILRKGLQHHDGEGRGRWDAVT